MYEVAITNFDLWTSALLSNSSAGRGGNGNQEAYGIKKLREFILEKALRGRLVPQDPNDEPASVLLARIMEDKAQLAHGGRLARSQAPLPPDEVEEGFN